MMKPLLMPRARGVGAVFTKTANLKSHLAHSTGAHIASGDSGDSGPPAFTGMSLTFDIPSEDSTLTLPMPGTNDFIINWGDGTEEKITTASPSHTYTTAGDYRVTMWGTASQFYFNNAGDKDKLIAINNLGDMDWSLLNKAFYGCINNAVFAGDGSVTKDIEDFSSTWQNNNLTSLPENLDVSSGTNFRFTWYGNNLTSLPDNLNVSGGTDFSYTWHGNNLTSLPDNLDVSNGTIFTNTWYNNNLTSLPENLDVSNGTYFRNTWYSNNLTSLPDNLDVSNGTYFNSAWRANNLDTVPLLNISKAEDIAYMFAYNGLISSIPLEQFDIRNVTNATNFLAGSSVPTATYDATLIAWDGLVLQPTLTEIHFGTSKYTPGGAAEAARTSLVNKGITIIDAGPI